MAESKRAYWQQQMDDWQASGKTQVSFCAERSLNKNTFAYWRKRLTKSTQQADISTTGFLPVHIQKPESQSSSVELIIKEEYKIKLKDDFSESTLKRLIRFLQAV